MYVTKVLRIAHFQNERLNFSHKSFDYYKVQKNQAKKEVTVSDNLLKNI